MKTYCVLIVVLFALFCGCEKIECDDAQACVVNIGTDTIHYSWGSNFYSDTLLPGDDACYNAGRIKAKQKSAKLVNITFMSDHGDINITVDECYVEKTIK